MMADKLEKTTLGKYAYKTRYAPTDKIDIEYPESDGKPIAETELHRDAIMKTIQILIEYFKDIPDVCVSGNMMMYYEEGNPKQSISPDVYVSFGVGRRRRRIYRFWDEGKPPDFIIEFSSNKTYKEDLEIKIPLYTEIGIKEYFFCDLEGCYLPSPLIGYRFVDGEYVSIAVDADGNTISETLDLELRLRGEYLDFYDPSTEKLLLTPAEEAQERAEQESIARQRAEQEVLLLQEEVKRLKSITKNS